MSKFLNPKIFGVRLTMLLFLYRRRLRAHPVQELLAGTGIAVGVALVFGVLLANASLTTSVRQLVHGLDGSASYALVARSPAGFPERLTQTVRDLPAVQMATPVLRQNVTIEGPSGRRAIQLIGVSPTLASLGGIAQQELGNGALLLSGGLGLPGGVASAVGARRGSKVSLVGNGQTRSEGVGAVISGEAVKALAGCPVAVALLPIAQRLTGRSGRVTEVLVEPRPGQQALAARELRALAGGRLDVEPADNEIGLLTQATKPNRQSTTLFSAISVMVGFLLALNAMLLTVPERRRFIAELRMQGYDPRQILLLLGSQAVMLGFVASLVGVAVGDVLSHTVYGQVPAYLNVAFPMSAEESVRASVVVVAVGCGVLATVLASLAPVFDLRPGRPADAVFRETGGGGELIRVSTLLRTGVAGAALVALVGVLVALAPSLTILGGVALALATLCLMPAVLAGIVRVLPRFAERTRSGAMIVAVSELRAITTRSVALAAIAGLAVYGSVAIGGARDDLLRGIESATNQYHGTAAVWVTAGNDVFNTNSFPTGGVPARIASSPVVRSVRVYRGGLIDIGSRRMWVRARPLGDPVMFESSQLISGDFAQANALIRRGGWAAVSSGLALERGLKLGSSFELPTASGIVRPRVAAITTNSGWPAGTITVSAPDYSRWWETTEATALEVDLRAGVGARAGARAVRSALGTSSGLVVQTSAESAAEADASARQGLRTLRQISMLLLVAAALAVAAALSATVWQRRIRLASLKIQGYRPGQLWRGLLFESGVMLGVGSFIGALVGVYGHALAGHWLTITTGFPAPFSIGAAHVFLTLGLIMAIALAVIALPGLIAARVPARMSLQE
ncbi:MAG TPA: FtsX-like permease family protein [Solirubrobacteraceae bacterium]